MFQKKLHPEQPELPPERPRHSDPPCSSWPPGGRRLSHQTQPAVHSPRSPQSADTLAHMTPSANRLPGLRLARFS